MDLRSIEQSVNVGAKAAKINALRHEEGAQTVGSLRHVLLKLGFGQEEIEDLADRDDKGVHAFVYSDESETIH